MKATPFGTLLVANRGEIALRIVRSAHALGLSTVAVYSDVDAGAPHVLAADRAVAIGPALGYLDIAAVIDAARRSGADAVHPGYGFLAENADFAQACIDAGLVFVGPSPAAMRALGDKAAGKQVLAAAGVPCVPGYDGADQGDDRLAAEAARIGWPVMIKATAGGGGRGMRRVDAAADFAAALRSARSEAQHAFGNATVLLERAIDGPRHVEIQVLADRHGNAIHLGERDCSVQRRHQKLIEEAPSPAVSPALRATMGAAAVAVVRAVGYEGAGTLEFLLDRDGRHWFIEMNTRLQVEHPVTEAVTGLDLVALQLRIAAGEPLPFGQDAVHLDGHAIEVRLCAEDAQHGFVPQTGRVALWRPASSLRVEHGLNDGAAVPPHYDSMVAKFIAHGPTRDAARRQLLRGLRTSVVLGVTTNQDFLARCLAHPGFAAGDATTGFIDADLDALLAPDTAADRSAAVLAAVLLAGAEVPHTWPVSLRFDIDGRSCAAVVQALGGRRLRVAIDGTDTIVDVVNHRPPVLRCSVDGVTDTAHWVQAADRLLLSLHGRAVTVVDRSRAAPARAEGATGDGLLRAAMGGRVIAVLAAVGDRVAAGQPLLTLEAMKMEHVQSAPCAGTLRELHAAVGDQVASGRVLAAVAPDG